MKHVVHYAEVNLFAEFVLLAVEDNFMDAIDSRYEGLRVFLCQKVMVISQDTLHKFELMSWDRLQNKFTILSVVKERTTFA